MFAKIQKHYTYRNKDRLFPKSPLLKYRNNKPGVPILLGYSKKTKKKDKKPLSGTFFYLKYLL